MSRSTHPRSAIISIGTELMLGQITDSNAPYLARELAACGAPCARQIGAPDDLGAIRDAFQKAAESADIVVATGGLGPTADDLTREALAAAAGTELAVDAACVEQIRAFFVRRGREMPETNSKQALVPRTGSAIPNSCGTAPGLRIKIRDAECFVLPGVPFEMREMYRQSVLPAVRAVAGGRVLRSRALHCFGINESDLGKRIEDLMAAGRNPGVGTSAEMGVISVRINAWAESEAAAGELLDDAEVNIRARLGDAVFGVDSETLASAVGGLLVSRGAAVSTAESCTGGLIAKMLTDVSGSSGYFAGGAVTYSNELKRSVLGVSDSSLAAYGAVSEPVAREMADGARREFQSDYAVSVTGVAGPTGGTPDKPVGLVFLGVATPESTAVREVRFGSDYPRSVIRERAARTALGLLRYKLL